MPAADAAAAATATAVAEAGTFPCPVSQLKQSFSWSNKSLLRNEAIVCFSFQHTHRLTQAELTQSQSRNVSSRYICSSPVLQPVNVCLCVCGLGKYASNHIDAQFLNTKCRLQTGKERERETQSSACIGIVYICLLDALH